MNALFCSVWFKFNTTDIVRKYPIFLLESFKILDGHYFFKKSDLDRIASFFENKFETEHDWFNEFFSLCEKKIKKLNSLIIVKAKISKFLKEFVECLACSMAIELIDFAAQRYIRNKAQEYGVSSDEIFRSIRPSRDTLLMEFIKQVAIVDVAKVESLVKACRWIGTHGFAGSPLSEKKIMQFKKNGTDKELFQILDSRFSNIVFICSNLVFYRSYIVENGDRVSYEYWEDIKNLGKKNFIDWNSIRYFTVDELVKLENGIFPTVNTKERHKAFGMIADQAEFHVVVGNDLIQEFDLTDKKESIEYIHELKGQVAFRGIAKGYVKIVESTSEMPKFKKGEILVVNETTPDFIFVMRMSSAIITNIGGITSHAAIVSRELKIPCIVGTKLATQVLKDGDLVEVDANSGVIKIIERNFKRVV